MFEDFYRVNKQLIDKAFDESEYQNTSKALNRFYGKLLSISNVINMIDRGQDSYVSYILIRTFVEHFLVSFYIWVRFNLDQNDKTAAIYYQEYVIQEFVKKINYSASNKINPSSRYLKLFSFIYRGLKKKGLLNEKHISDLNRTANVFDIKKISKYIDSNIPDDVEVFIKPHRIKEMLEFYNYYSTFVHGGPSADIVAYESEDKGVAYYEIADAFKIWTKNILGVNRFLNLYFLSHENKELHSRFVKEIEKKRMEETKHNKK